MSKGGSPPPAPDPKVVAAAQTATNKETAIAQANLNHVDQYTPEGSVTYKVGSINADGTPRYIQTQTYSPDEMLKYQLGNQVGIATDKLAVSNIKRVQDAQAKPFTFDGMQPLRTNVGQGLPFGIKAGPTGAYGVQDSVSGYGKVQDGIGPADVNGNASKVADSVYGQATSRLNPRFQQDENDLRSRLAAQGISENSDAYRREMDNFGRSKNDAYNQATYSGIQAGANEQSRIFGIQAQQGQFANQAQDQKYTQALGVADLFNSANQQKFAQDQGAAAFNNQAQGQAYNQDTANASFGNNARQQQISEASYVRNLPLNEIAALMGTGGSVNQPNFQPFSQTGVANTDYTGIVNNNYTNAMNRYNQEQASRSSMLGSIFGTVGSVAALSDRRLKRNIKRVGTLLNGIPTYSFEYLWSKAQQFGVMAQEVFKVLPEAVGVDANGRMYVDYGKVYA